MADHARLAAMAEAVRPAGDDLYEEARLAHGAAHALAGDGWRDLYLAHFSAAHPEWGAPIEDGVMQAGDRVRSVGSQGAEQGPATVLAISRRETHGGGKAVQVEYALDEPFETFHSPPKLGGVVSDGGLVHLRDWPASMLGEGRPAYEFRDGEVERPPGWAAPGR